MPNYASFAMALTVLVAAAASAQQGPQGARVAGTVKSVTPSDLVLTTANGDVDLAITARTRVLLRRQGVASDIKPGAYLGTANQNGAAAGTGTATEVHVMDNGPNVNSPMNDSGLMMTNGHVKSVTSTSEGQEMDVDYGQASTRHVVVRKDTSITRMVDVGPEGLKPGIGVSTMTAAGADGKLMATFISITAAAKPAP